jgi:hypothetical protein
MTELLIVSNCILRRRIKRSCILIGKLHIPTPTLEHALYIGQLLVNFHSLSHKADFMNLAFPTEVQRRVVTGAHPQRIAYQPS